MARLPEYQQTGRVSPDLPQFNFESIKESVRASQSLTSSLDRLSIFAFEEAAKNTAAEAKQFSINNPLTLEQIQEAAKSGIKPEDLVAASGGGQIWQDTVTKIQGEQLRTQLEVLGKQALMDLQTKVDTNQINNMSDVQAKQEAIVNGLRKSLSFSPDSVSRFDTTMGVVTSSLYKDAQNKLTKNYEAGQQLNAQKNLGNTVRGFETLLNNGDVNNFETLTKLTEATVEQEFRLALGGGADFALKHAQDTRKILNDTVINQITKVALDPSFATDADKALNKIAKGEFVLSDGRNYTDLYKNLPVENQAKIRTAIRDQFVAINRTEKEVEERNVDAKKAEVNNIEIEYYKTKNPRLLEDLKRISRETNGKAINASTIESIAKSGETKDENVQYTDNVIKMKDEIRKGRYDSLDALYSRGMELGINRQAINKYIAPSFLNKSDARVDEIARDFANATNPSGSTSRRVRIEMGFLQDVDITYEAQLRDGVDNKNILSKAEIAGKLADKKMQGNSQKSQKVTELNSLGGKYKLNFTSASSLDALTEQDIDRKVKNKTDRDEIKRQLRNL